MAEPLPDFLQILRVLTDHGVDFILVGGLCAVLHGAPINTTDVDIVHSRQPDNPERLVAALESLDAHYRMQTKRIAPTASLLASAGHHLLDTSAGPLDALGTIADDLGYEQLRPFTAPVLIEIGLTIHLLQLEKLIELKEKAGRPKDQAVLFQLRAVLKEQHKASADQPEPPAC
jgi:predicted nucleotidyltransferase